MKTYQYKDIQVKDQFYHLVYPDTITHKYVKGLALLVIKVAQN